MPSHLHENLVEMFRDRPELAADLLTDPLGISVPTFEQAQVSSGELNDVMPTEFRADLVVSLTKGDEAVLAVVVEAQLSPVKRKRRSWPAYVGTLHARLGCPIALLVMCPDRATAAWCAEPIPFGVPNLVLTPIVMGPRQVPPITDPVAAQRTLELAVLSALAHGNNGPDQKLIFESFLSALSTLDRDHAKRYADVVMETLHDAARAQLEELMSTTSYQYGSAFALRYVAEGEAKGRAEGEAKGKAEAVLHFLSARGIELTAEARERISTCTDINQLDVMIDRAATVTTADDLFS